MHKICIFKYLEPFQWLFWPFWTWCCDLDLSRSPVRRTFHTRWYLHMSNTWAVVSDSGRKKPQGKTICCKIFVCNIIIWIWMVLFDRYMCVCVYDYTELFHTPQSLPNDFSPAYAFRQNLYCNSQCLWCHQVVVVTSLSFSKLFMGRFI